MITLRQATTNDIPALWTLRTRAVAHACAAHYAPEVLSAWLAAPAPASLSQLVAAGGGIVAVDDGQSAGYEPAGYAVLNADSGEVDAVFVAPERHGQGLGLLLLDQVERMALAAGRQELFLSASLNAVPFYERAGFTAVRSELYPHRSGVAIPSVYMTKALAPHG